MARKGCSGCGGTRQKFKNEVNKAKQSSIAEKTPRQKRIETRAERIKVRKARIEARQKRAKEEEG